MKAVEVIRKETEKYKKSLNEKQTKAKKNAIDDIVEEEPSSNAFDED